MLIILGLILAVAASDATMTVSWYSTEGTTYRVQAKPGLVADWTDASDDVTATNAVTRKAVPRRGDEQSFFRVIAVSDRSRLGDHKSQGR